MTTEDLFEVPRQPKDLVEDALDTSILAAGIVIGNCAGAAFDIVQSERDSDIDIPIKVVFNEGLHSTPQLVLHSDAFLNYAEELQARYPSITQLDVAKLYVGATVIPLVVLSKLDQFSASKVDKLYDHMAHADSLEEKIAARLLELGNESEALARLAVIGRDESEICRINRYRLAMGALFYQESITGSEVRSHRQAIDFSDRAEQSAFAELVDLPLQMKKYVSAAVAMGADRHVAEQQFLSMISDIELATAFPMSFQELSLIASCIK